MLRPACSNSCGRWEGAEIFRGYLEIVWWGPSDRALSTKGRTLAVCPVVKSLMSWSLMRYHFPAV